MYETDKKKEEELRFLQEKSWYEESEKFLKEQLHDYETKVTQLQQDLFRANREKEIGIQVSAIEKDKIAQQLQEKQVEVQELRERQYQLSKEIEKLKTQRINQ